MTDRPIIFSAPMILALLAGRKTQTRRIATNAWMNLYREFMFRKITGFPDYLSGRDGVIYTMKNGNIRAMKGNRSSRGYLTVSLCGGGKVQTKSIHVLTAESWFGPRPHQDWVVRHLNANQTDNDINNLDWGSASDNWSDRRASENGIHEEHPSAKLTMDKARAIRESSKSQRALASKFGITQSVIWGIKKDQLWVPATSPAPRNCALPEPLKFYVRENFAIVPVNTHRCSEDVQYTINPNNPDMVAIYAAGWDRFIPRWKPSIHMPRWASRITLTVTDVRIQRLQDISEEDAIAEGIYEHIPGSWSSGEVDGSHKAGTSAIAAYAVLWESLHGPGSWADNPWIVALTFTVEQRNIDAGPS